MKFAENSEYKVVITRDAKTHLAQILRYIRQDLGIMLYKIIDDMVRVDGICHDLQDYENLTR